MVVGGRYKTFPLMITMLSEIKLKFSKYFSHLNVRIPSLALLGNRDQGSQKSCMKSRILDLWV